MREAASTARRFSPRAAILIVLSCGLVACAPARTDDGIDPDPGASDGGTADGGALPDGGPSTDGGAPSDGGTAIDSGTPVDGGPVGDAGSATDAGPTQPGTGVTGSPCSQDADCASLLCIDVGGPNGSVCTTTCSNSTSCVPGWTCETLGGTSTRACTCQSSSQTCDGLDDDCNGIVDDQPAANNWCAAQAGTGASCVAGACQCPGTQTLCNGSCVDTSTDPENCGGCGIQCSSGLCGDTLNASMLSQPASWNFNSTASYDSTNAKGALTTTGYYAAGSILYANAINADQFQVTFNFVLGGGDGIAFVVEQTGPTAIGANAGGLGMSGLTGYGVEYDLYDNMSAACNEASAPHVAVDSLSSCGGTLPTSISSTGDLATATPPVNIADGAMHASTITWYMGLVSVTVDGVSELSNVTVPGFTPGGRYYFGFTGATGGYVGVDEIWDVVIEFPAAQCL